MKSPKLSIILALLLSSAASVAILPARARADESLSQVSLSHEQTERWVSYLQQRIARHRQMTADQIIGELRTEAAHNRSQILTRNAEVGDFDRVTQQGVEDLAQLGKEGIIALETLSLQKPMTSGQNSLMLVTRSMMGGLGCFQSSAFNYHNNEVFYSRTDAESGWCGVGAVLLSLLTVPLDLVIFPIEFIVSAINGF